MMEATRTRFCHERYLAAISCGSVNITAAREAGWKIPSKPPTARGATACGAPGPATALDSDSVCKLCYLAGRNKLLNPFVER